MVSFQSAAILAALAATVSTSVAGETVLLDFSAPWCGPCQSMTPLVDRLAAEGYPLRKVNVDEERTLSSQYGVTSIPCFVMLVDGKEVDREVGVVSYDRLRQMFQRAQPSASGAAPTAAAAEPRGGWPAAADVPPAPVAPSGVAAAASAGDGSPNLPQGDLDALIRFCVRIEVQDGTGQSYGTGTIIDAREGEALILTCGHLFRDAKEKGSIQVDLFGPAGRQRVAGRVVSYDLARDLGFVSIRPPSPVAVARVAPADARFAPGDRVVSVGCDHGRDPSVRRSHVTAVDRYEGPPNIEVAGAPVEGRSGGGLFDAGGQVIGVCFAADSKDNEGLYTGLPAIHAELDRLGLSSVYGNASATMAATATAAPVSLASHGSAPPIPQQVPGAEPGRDWSTAAVRPVAVGAQPTDQPEAGTLSRSEQAAIAEIRRRAEGTEVICIIRPADTRKKSEILVLEDVSNTFLDRLTAAARPRSPQQLTSMQRPLSSTRHRPPVHTVDTADARRWHGARRP